MSLKQSWDRSTPVVLYSCSCPCTSPPSGSGRRVEGLSTWHRRTEKGDIVWNEKRALQPEVSGSEQMFWLCLIKNSSNVMWCQENEVMP
ncbi:hypothetical protein FKM82_023110 [Ascaphus truei]